jgi:hypothetical protein
MERRGAKAHHCIEDATAKALEPISNGAYVMNKLMFIALTSVAFSPVVATAQSFPLIVGSLPRNEITVTATPTFEQQLEIAAEGACEKPFLRNLKGQQIYAECLAEARAQAEAILAARAAARATELALR